MANLFCYLRILIVKTAINQTFNQSQYSMTSFMLMALGKFLSVYYFLKNCTEMCF